MLGEKRMSSGPLYKFYKSAAWRHCKNGYAKSKSYLCEECMKNGVYRTARIVHHKIFLDESNYNDPQVSLNWDNLMLLCQSHHESIHNGDPRRYCFDENGDVLIR